MVDAHFLQPGLAVVPMWPSKVIDLKEHFAWITQHYGQKPDSFSQFALNGGDIVQYFIDRCRAKGRAAFQGSILVLMQKRTFRERWFHSHAQVFNPSNFVATHREPFLAAGGTQRERGGYDGGAAQLFRE
jgi:hypothetical protein